MIKALTTGIVLGLSAGLVPGPLLTLVIAQTLEHNTKEGIKVAVTPLLTDVPIITTALLILSRITQFTSVLGVITLAGGSYVLFLSYEIFVTRPGTVESHPQRPNSIRKGLLVNFLNPQPYLFWSTVGAPLMIRQSHAHPIAPFVFILCFYLMLVGSKIGVAYVVDKSRSFLTSSIYHIVLKVLAAVLAIFAVVLLKDAMGLLGLLSND